jgi:hypothetical protein
MEKELKEYLDRISGDIAEIKETTATKDDIRKLDRKLTKKINETIDYVKLVDQDVSDHRRNTEAHNVTLRNA